MTMHRRPVSRGRRLAAISAFVMLVACVLPWYRFVGDAGDRAYTAFDGSGIVVFVVALATLALVTLPYAAGDRPVGIDRWVAFALLAGAALVGLAMWPAEFVLLGELRGLAPDRAPGLWLALVGALALSRAAFDIAREPIPR